MFTYNCMPFARSLSTSLSPYFLFLLTCVLLRVRLHKQSAGRFLSPRWLRLCCDKFHQTVPRLERKQKRLASTSIFLKYLIYYEHSHWSIVLFRREYGCGVLHSRVILRINRVYVASSKQLGSGVKLCKHET